MKHLTFNDFLEEYWMSNEMEGQTKDQVEDAIDRWMSNLDAGDVVELGEKYGLELVERWQADLEKREAMAL